MSERILLVTVSDDRFGRKEGGYKKTQLKIAELIKNNPHLEIDLQQWDWEKITETDFYKANRVLLDNIDPARNGRAYKPFIIQHALQTVAFGEFVIYNDCSPELWDLPFTTIPGKYRPHILRELITINDDILTPFVKWDSKKKLTNGLGIHTHANFTTNRCLNRMNARAHMHDFQHASGFVGLRKSEKTIAFMREWLYWNLMPDCACMGDPAVKDDYSFWDGEECRKMGHRHDQSISGVLINKLGGHLVDMTPYEGINPYNFLQYCRTDCTYQFISSINPNPPGNDQIIKGSTVKNEAGVVLTVFEIWPDIETGIEKYVVGKHRQSAYFATRDKLTLIHQ